MPRTTPPVLVLVVALLTVLTLTTSAAFATPSSTAAPPTAPERAAGNAVQSVLVTLRHRADLGRARAARGPARLREVVDALQHASDRGQARLVRRLRTWSRTGRVTSYRRLWVVDAVSVTATPRVIRRIAARPDVRTITPDAITLVTATSTVPPNLTTLRVPDVWAHGDDGTGVVMATLDTGADVTHPDLESRWRGGDNSWYDPYGEHPTFPVDLDGHGTGTLGAIVGGDASGTAIGVAPGARWISARVFDDRGASTATAVHLAFQWLLDPDHDPSTADAPQVVNGSWSLGSGPGCDLTFQPDVQALSQAGILPVFAAGNYGATAGSGVSPANYPESLAVGALADSTTALSSSSRGPSTCGGRTGPYPDVSAPGRDVLTTDRYGLYQVASGTSMAAPQVAGTLALLLSARPGLTVDQQQDLVTGTAVDIGPPGADGDTGAGRVDALAAYDVATAPVPDFALSVPASASAAAGSAVDLPVTVTPGAGFTGDVSLTVTTPPGVTATANPAVVAGGAGASTVTLSVAGDTAPGSYEIRVGGTSESVGHEVSTTVTVTPATPSSQIEFSTRGDVKLPGLLGRADNADLVSWDGTAFQRTVDASVSPYSLPTGANVDGLSRVDGKRFYVCFSQDVKLPDLGWVQDEDVALFDGRHWRLWFDGSTHHLTTSALALDAISIVDGSLYFSTAGAAKPPGVNGTGDDSDIFRWDGRGFTRVWDATARGLPPWVNIDGLDVTNRTHFAVSFSNSTVKVPGLGQAQDEDVLGYTGGVWRTAFDGTAAGLTAPAMDIDAFDARSPGPAREASSARPAAQSR